MRAGACFRRTLVRQCRRGCCNAVRAAFRMSTHPSRVSTVLVTLAIALSTGGAAGASKPTCTKIPGAALILKAGARIQVGETHGNAETPRAVGELACLALSRGRPVRLALELPASEDATIASYLNGGGTATEREALLASPFWTRPEQDGRSSRAMAQLIERVRQMRSSGGDIQIVTFDDSGGDRRDRDSSMAERLLAAIAAEPKATFVILSGDAHARKQIGLVPFRPKSVFMAEHVSRRGVDLVTLRSRYRYGSTWACIGPSCGTSVIGQADGRPLGVTLSPSNDGAYDGVLDVGVPTYSPPAAVGLTREQAALSADIGLRIQALVDYNGKKYASCGGILSELAARHRRGDYAYYAACCWARHGARDRAFAALEVAANYGLSQSDQIDMDPDLASLRTDPGWQSLRARLKK